MSDVAGDTSGPYYSALLKGGRFGGVSAKVYSELIPWLFMRRRGDLLVDMYKLTKRMAYGDTYYVYAWHSKVRAIAAEMDTSAVELRVQKPEDDPIVLNPF
jgi:hypothetical protein